ncbi:MAG TPA: CotH kinase family protein, partial [Phycicoccus sp.]|nr:CotH kinase family protein [Phycicoccus sp.]
MVTQGQAAQAAPVTPNLPTMNIVLDGGVKLSTVEAGSKDTKYMSSVGIEDGSGAYNLPMTAATEFKGRGNYTWRLPKRPYQIKFDKSTSILGLPAAKAWVLLANDADGSLMRNKLMYDFAGAAGLYAAPNSRWVDLRVNGEYRGNYLVSEKVEVKKNRLDLKSPNGVLAELDNNYGYAEPYKFITTTTQTTFTLKDAKGDIPDATKPVTPLPADTQVGWDDMRATLERLDQLLNASNPDWATISSIIDVPSFVKYYFVYEMAENPEIVASSIFFYKDGVGSKLFAGPVWDFDSSLGTYDHTESLGAFTNAEYIKNADQLRLRGNNWYRNLFRHPEFVAAANAAWQTGGVGAAASQLPAKIAQYKATVASSAANNFNKWRVLGTPTHLVAGEGRNYSSTYDGEVSYLSNWVTARYNHLKKAYGDVPLVRYQGHAQSFGWLPKVNNGQIGGTVNAAKWLEAVNFTVSGASVSGGIQANGHVASIGWQGWNSSTFGTTGRGLALEAVQLRLTGDLAAKYDVSYRAHVRNVGWQPWVTNGATAGTTGQAKPIEAVMIRLLLKSPANPTGPVTSTPSPTVTP